MSHFFQKFHSVPKWTKYQQFENEIHHKILLTFIVLAAIISTAYFENRCNLDINSASNLNVTLIFAIVLLSLCPLTNNCSWIMVIFGCYNELIKCFDKSWNNKSKTLKVNKKVVYPDFYKILITKKISDQLSLNDTIPFIEINTVKKNKSFVAEKATIFKEEKKVHNTAPVAKVRINNISKIEETDLGYLRSFFYFFTIK